MRNRPAISSNNIVFPNVITKNGTQYIVDDIVHKTPQVLCITSFPPRECGIATYSEDLINVLSEKFDGSFNINICALESDTIKHTYSDKVKYILNPAELTEFTALAAAINSDDDIKVVMLQHEFGFFYKNEEKLLVFLKLVKKPMITVFHTVLPNPDPILRQTVTGITDNCDSVIVMTNTSEKILMSDYAVEQNKITVIPHGTHLVKHLDKGKLKKKYGLQNKKVLSTFGLLSSGKSIETTLAALPAIIKQNKDVVFLILGKTHPCVVKEEGEKYRDMLESMVDRLKIRDHVKFVNSYLSLPDLLEYLQLTDIYLFTSKDPNQAVSGTFSYAMSCGCPIVSTPIPHAREFVSDNAGLIFDFGNSAQLSEAVNRLFNDKELLKNMSLNGLHRIASTAWENSAIAHALLFEKVTGKKITISYALPEINLDHVKRLTTDFGMIQFSKINQPDIESGYTLDDNARALVAVCQHYKLTGDESDIKLIQVYFNFIKHCLQSEGYFLNYVNAKGAFTSQNNETNLADANGRAIWALGYLLSMKSVLPEHLVVSARTTLQNGLLRVNMLYSTRALAFVIKGLYYYHSDNNKPSHIALVNMLSRRLVQMYKHESSKGWEWFESYLTYANSILPEAMLCAYKVTGDVVYKDIAKASFDFLLSQTFKNGNIKVISNKGWLQKGENASNYGEQPIDVAYTILALDKFYSVFKDDDYLDKMKVAFNWFLGHNHLNKIIYNPCTGGCFDGLEKDHVNLNQGAESTISYLMARLIMEKYTTALNPDFVLGASPRSETDFDIEHELVKITI